MSPIRRPAPTTLLALLLFACGVAGAAPPDVGELLGGLELRHVGPIGNRAPAVVGVAGEPGHYYIGAASGGIFETEDGGITWTPIFDQQRVASIGALAVAPSDPNVLWVGTGETFIRSNVSIGNGVYRSTDGGDSFEHLGLERTGRIGRIVVHPDDPDVAWVAALGHSYGPQPERGVYRTRDGGSTWEQVLFVDEETGAIDLALHPGNHRVLYAATWQFVMRTSGRTSGGPGSGIFRSTDGGSTWERLGSDEENGRGLPDGPWGKIGLAVSADAPDRVYALIETSSNAEFAPVAGPDGDGFQGVLWRSDDRGGRWTLVSRDNDLIQRPLYYTRMVVAPDDADEITFFSVRQSESHDGGRTTETNNSGWDHHDGWIDPLDPDRRIVGHDGGVSISTNRGRTWLRPQLPIAQMYHVNLDDRVPYWIYGNRQDGPSMMGPSNTLTGSEIPIGAWSSVGGCEVGFAVPTPGRSHIVWTGCYDGILERFDRRTGQSRDVSVWPLAIESWPGEDLRYRFQWNFPITISPHAPGVVYVGSQHVHRTDDGGQSWSVISPDLSTGDPELMQRTGGLTFDDAGPTIAAVVFSIAESVLEQGEIWAGTNDGRLHLTRDGGGTWSDLTSALQRAAPGMPELGTISNIEPSRHVAGKAYLTVDAHQENDAGTWVFVTDDHGQSFRSLRSDIPQDVFSYAHCVREDPEVPGLLYLGTHNILYVSFDDGGAWHELRANLPPAPIHWLAVQEHFGDLVLATYGRGFWVLDDLSALRAIARGDLDQAEGPTLLPARDTYRFGRREEPVSQEGVPATGTNPEVGATLHVYRPTTHGAGDGENAEPFGALEIRIRDAQGALVRTLDDVPGSDGLHRLHWDLRGERTTEVQLRTRPRDNPELALPDKGWRPLSEGGRFSILQPPGRYTVELVADEEVLDSQSLTVLADPNLDADPSELDQQIELVESLRQDLEGAANLINDIERVRVQLEQLDDRLGDREDAHTATERIAELASTIEEIEDELFDLRLTSAGQDTLRWRRKLYARLAYLARRVHQTDDRPTDAQREVAELLHDELEALRARWSSVVDEQMPVFNRWLQEAGLAGVVVERRAGADNVP